VTADKSPANVQESPSKVASDKHRASPEENDSSLPKLDVANGWRPTHIPADLSESERREFVTGFRTVYLKDALLTELQNLRSGPIDPRVFDY
jgi:hypothetical protein